MILWIVYRVTLVSSFPLQALSVPSIPILTSRIAFIDAMWLDVSKIATRAEREKAGPECLIQPRSTLNMVAGARTGDRVTIISLFAFLGADPWN